MHPDTPPFRPQLLVLCLTDKAHTVIGDLDASALKNMRLSRFCGSLSQGLFGWLAHDARVIILRSLGRTVVLFRTRR
jgi:hypothetical protein